MATLDGTKKELRQRVEGVLAENPTFWIESAFRSPAKQAELYKAFLAGTGAPANPPNTSKHETGDAVDIGCTWMDQVRRANAFKRWGLWVRYSHEPWHVELHPSRTPIPKLRPQEPEPQKITESEEDDDDMPKNTDVMACVKNPNGPGYWCVSWDGGVSNNDAAPFYGSYGHIPGKHKTIDRNFRSIVATDDGYKIIATTGEGYGFSPATAKEFGLS